MFSCPKATHGTVGNILASIDSKIPTCIHNPLPLGGPESSLTFRIKADSLLSFCVRANLRYFQQGKLRWSKGNYPPASIIKCNRNLHGQFVSVVKVGLHVQSRRANYTSVVT